MATSPKNTSAPSTEPAKKPFRKSPFIMVDLSKGSTNRQIRVDTSTYDDVQRLRLQLNTAFAGELGAQKLTLEEVLVLAVQAGTAALTSNPHAPRTVS
jgi:hypothetical protein